ncbi:hypothetical protein B0H66DRAFT_168138 [Apodospora peruviana]|uniref:Uncharacterized protein n=1 Tax=Apodospora peruviana TaxID=516989 RepID=A0AAE0IKP7_9PEZI|nr:hypothetical protein B0H66DRAFT_168138 [Apodospora peruviana]
MWVCVSHLRFVEVAKCFFGNSLGRRKNLWTGIGDLLRVVVEGNFCHTKFGEISTSLTAGLLHVEIGEVGEVGLLASYSSLEIRSSPFPPCPSTSLISHPPTHSLARTLLLQVSQILTRRSASKCNSNAEKAILSLCTRPRRWTGARWHRESQARMLNDGEYINLSTNRSALSPFTSSLPRAIYRQNHSGPSPIPRPGLGQVCPSFLAAETMMPLLLVERHSLQRTQDYVDCAPESVLETTRCSVWLCRSGLEDDPSPGRCLDRKFLSKYRNPSPE